MERPERNSRFQSGKAMQFLLPIIIFIVLASSLVVADERSSRTEPGTAAKASVLTEKGTDDRAKVERETPEEDVKEGVTPEEDVKEGAIPEEDVKVEDAEDDEAKGEVGERKEEEKEEEHEAPSGIRDPKPCEVCKYLAVELQGRLEETGKVKDYIVTGHGIMPGDIKRKDYHRSELRLIEAVHEPHVCDKILEYDIHAERKRSLRYAKGSSETRRTLHALVHKGVKVDLGIPYEMWKRDLPPTEITHLQRLCFDLVEQYEDDIEDWYWGHQEVPLVDYLCRNRVLKEQDHECLGEEFVPEEQKEEEEKGEEKSEKSEKEATTPDESETKGDPGTASGATPPSSEPLPASPSKPSSAETPGPPSSTSAEPRAASPPAPPSVAPSKPQAVPPVDGDSINRTPPPGSKHMPRTTPPPTRTASTAPSSPSSARDEL